MSHESRQGRADRLRARADKATTEADAAYQRSRDAVSGIPLGQPILVGHHSEGRHRAAIKRAQNAATKSCELSRKASDLYQRAIAAETNTAIYGDDPEAIEKLTAKVAALEEARATYVAINKLVRKNDAAAMVTDYGMTEAQAAALLEGDFCGRKGFPPYVLSNLAGNLKRYKERLADLQRKQAQAEDGPRVLTLDNGITINENFDADRLQIFFKGKPDDDTRQQLKRNGFRWSPNFGAWQANLHNSARYKAAQVLGIDYPKDWYTR